MSSRIAQLQVLLEGVPLPASKQELLHHARREVAAPGELALLEALPDREYASIDQVAETLHPIQPVSSPQQPEQPSPERGRPPGGDAYTDPSPETGRVHERLPS